MRLPIVLAAALLPGPTAAPSEYVVADERPIATTINGVAGQVRIDPAATGMMLITGDWADRAGLKGGMIGWGFRIGPTTIWGKSAVARIEWAPGAAKHRIGWNARPYAAGIDGVIGPGMLPQPVVRFVLGEARSGESTTTLPMVDGGGMFGAFDGLFTTLDVDGEPIRVRFDPNHPRTLATAGAAQRIAAANGGRLSGDTATQEIAFGIERPVRTMQLDRPLRIGPLAIASLGVRTGDFGHAGAIPDADAKVDPDEVVVTAQGKKRDRKHDRVSLGRDVLGRCSAIVFDKPARQIRLTCA